jgi:hypothetical protein
MTEKVIEDYLFDKVKKCGGMSVKLNSARGLPDRLVLLPDSRAYFVELKRPVGGKFEPLQLRTHERMRALGAVVVVAKSKEEIDTLLGSV